MAQTALHPVTDDGDADSLADDETRTRRGIDLPGSCGSVAPLVRRWTTRRGRPARLPRRTALAKSSRRLSRFSGDSTTSRVPRCYAERAARPLPRRFARIARPARVRIRRRKPWVLARRRLFGWKVRLLTRGLQRMNRVWRYIAWLSPCAHEELACSPEWTPLNDHKSVISPIGRQAAAAIDNSTSLRYARLRHPVKPSPPCPTLCTGCGQRLEPYPPA